MMTGAIIFFLICIGCTGGFLSGLLGMGGGVIFVPALFFTMKVLGVETPYLMQLCVGTSLGLVMVTAMFSAYNHHKHEAVNLTVVKSWGAFLVAGMMTGSFLAGYVDGRVLKIVFSGVTLAVAVYMVIERDKSSQEKPHLLTSRIQQMICLVIGNVAALAGLGGTVMTVPLLRYCGVGIRKAIGAAVTMTVMMSMAGVTGYVVTGMLQSTSGLPPFSLGFVNLAAVAVIAPASLLAVPLGVKLSHRMGRVWLRRVFAVSLVLVSIKMLVTI